MRCLYASLLADKKCMSLDKGEFLEAQEGEIKNLSHNKMRPQSYAKVGISKGISAEKNGDNIMGEVCLVGADDELGEEFVGETVEVSSIKLGVGPGLEVGF